MDRLYFKIGEMLLGSVHYLTESNVHRTRGDGCSHLRAIIIFFVRPGGSVGRKPETEIFLRQALGWHMHTWYIFSIQAVPFQKLRVTTNSYPQFEVRVTILGEGNYF